MIWFIIKLFMIYVYASSAIYCLNQPSDITNFVGVGFAIAALVTFYFLVMEFFND